jgi:heat shock protein HtpX
MISNILKTGLLFAVLTGFLLAASMALGISPITALSFAFIMNFAVYLMSDKIVTRMMGAHVVSEAEAPDLHGIVASLALEMGIPKPKVAIVNTPIPNAFATGRSPRHATVCVHSGLLKIVNRDELQAVLSHELTHVRNYDTLTSVIAATIAGAITYLARFGMFIGPAYGYGQSRNRNDNGMGALLMLILAPIAAVLVQMAISRSREYAADEGGAKVSGKPLGLVSALQKMESWKRNRNIQGNPATAQLYIVNPFSASTFTSLFSTHPPTEKRIERLLQIAKSMGQYSLANY